MNACAVLVATRNEAGERFVTVLPITHAPPRDTGLIIEIPDATKRRLGLDDARSWIVISEANSFRWPGPDLRSTPSGEVAYGALPQALFNAVKARLLAALKARRAHSVARSE